jgi:hypothetical protein
MLSASTSGCLDWFVGLNDFAFSDILMNTGPTTSPLYNHRFFAGDLIVPNAIPDPRWWGYSVLDRTWIGSSLSQTIHRLQIRTVCSAQARVFIIASISPISPVAPNFPDVLFNNPQDRMLVPFTTSMDKIVGIGACTYYDYSFIDVRHAVLIPAFHTLCVQVLFALPQPGQTSRVTVTYSQK